MRHLISFHDLQDKRAVQSTNSTDQEAVESDEVAETSHWRHQRTQATTQASQHHNYALQQNSWHRQVLHYQADCQTASERTSSYEHNLEEAVITAATNGLWTMFLREQEHIRKHIKEHKIPGIRKRAKAFSNSYLYTPPPLPLLVPLWPITGLQNPGQILLRDRMKE